MKRIIMLGLMLVLLVSLIYAIPFAPQGNIDLKNYFNMTNLNYFDAFMMLGNIDLNGYDIVNATNISTTNINASNFYDNGIDISAIYVEQSGDQMTGNLTFSSGVGVNASYILNEPWINEAQESSLNVNSSNYWDSFGVASDLNNLITLHWNNITNKFIESIAGNYLFMNGAELNFNETLLNNNFIFRTEENDLNVNRSNFWDDYDVASDLNYKIILDADNITSGVFTWARIPTIYEANISDLKDYIETVNEGNLNVNSSDYWDSLDSESDLTPSNFLTAGDYLFYAGDVIKVNNSAILGSANDLDASGDVINDSHYHGNSTITNLDWDKLQNYPVACPENTFVTQLGDSITCTGISDIYLLNTGDTATGDYVITGEINATSFYQNGIKVVDDSTGLSALTSGEIDQLENIGTTNISSTQWGYLGGQDQTVTTTSSPTFATLNTGQGANELYAMNQNVRTTDSPTFDGLNLTDAITGLNYTINANSLQQNLTGFWGFEYGSGGTAYDSSREGNDGSLVNMDNSTCWVAGKDGTALEFDGVDDYVIVPHDSSLDSANALSFSLWVNFRNYTNVYIIGKKNYDNWGLKIGENGELIFTSKHFNGITTDYDNLIYNLGLNDDWVMITGTFSVNESSKKLFVNGNLVAEKTGVDGSIDKPFSDWPISATGSYNLYMGYDADNSVTLDGYLDNVRVYNRALSEQEVRALYLGLGSQPTGHLALK